MSQVTEQSVRFQTALASIKLIQASAALALTEDDFDFLTSNKQMKLSVMARMDADDCDSLSSDIVGADAVEPIRSLNAEDGVSCGDACVLYRGVTIDS